MVITIIVSEETNSYLLTEIFSGYPSFTFFIIFEVSMLCVSTFIVQCEASKRMKMYFGFCIWDNIIPFQISGRNFLFSKTGSEETAY